MGEARRKIEARAAGEPEPRPTCCPSCASKHIRFIAPGSIPHFACEIGVCLDCRAIWEAFPPLYVEDEVCSEPCDNCAFRPGSPEQQDKEKWRALIASLDPKNSADGEFIAGRFYCHKNVPIDMQKGPGNFLFPKKPIQLFDGMDPVDGFDTAKMRTCSGFLRMVWAKTGVRR